MPLLKPPYTCCYWYLPSYTCCYWYIPPYMLLLKHTCLRMPLNWLIHTSLYMPLLIVTPIHVDAVANTNLTYYASFLHMMLTILTSVHMLLFVLHISQLLSKGIKSRGSLAFCRRPLLLMLIKYDCLFDFVVGTVHSTVLKLI